MKRAIRFTNKSPVRFHTIDNREFKKLGLDPKKALTMNNVKNLNELATFTPNIIVGQAAYNSPYYLNDRKVRYFKKGKGYVMPLFLYNDIIRSSKTPLPPLKPHKIQFKKIYRKYQGESLDGKTLLIWRTGGIGDLLFIKPNIDFLKKRYPSCKIIFATSPAYQPMVKDWPEIDELYSIPFPLQLMHRSHYHITFQGVVELIKQAEKENVYLLFNKWMNLHLHPDMLHPVQKPNIELVREVKEIFENEFGLLPGVKTCLVQLRANSPVRTPHMKFWRKVMGVLVNELDYHIVITDLPKFQNVIEESIKKEFDNCNPRMFHVFCKHSKTIAHSVALASLCDLCVGTDSSIIHIAESVGTKNFGFFGPFPGEIRVTTYKHSSYINCDRLICAPCFTHGHAPCPNSFQQTSNCYNSMDFELFRTKLKELILR